MSCSGVVVNAAIVAGKAAKPASAGTAKIPTYLGSVSVRRGRCVVIVSPSLITVKQRSLSWSRNGSVSCGERGHFTVVIDAGKQVFITRYIMQGDCGPSGK